MRIVFFITLCSTFTLAGCGSSENPWLISSEIVKNQQQRYQFKEASGGYPVIIFDSVTGCVRPVFYAADGSGSLSTGQAIGQTCDTVGVVDHDGVK